MTHLSPPDFNAVDLGHQIISPQSEKVAHRVCAAGLIWVCLSRILYVSWWSKRCSHDHVYHFGTGGSVTRVLLARAPPCAAQNLADKFITVAKVSRMDLQSWSTMLLAGGIFDTWLRFFRLVLRLRMTKLATRWSHSQKPCVQWVSLMILHERRASFLSRKKTLICDRSWPTGKKAEKNTFDDYKTFPVQGLNSLYCTEPPKNPELNGLHFKQNKDNPPDRFLDPATRNTVMLDQFPGTRPLGESPGQGSAPSGTPASNSTKGSTSSNATAGATSAIETTAASTSSNETSGSITSGTASAPASVKTNVTVSSSVEKSGPPNGTTGLKGADFYATPGAKA